MTNTIIRIATIEDAERIAVMEREVWQGEAALSPEKITQCIQNSPRGNIVAQAPDGRICGFVSFCFLDYAHFEAQGCCSWYHLSGDGTASTHDPSAKDLFGINLGVVSWAERGTSFLLLEAVLHEGIRSGIERYFLGSRMPGYHRRHHKMSAEEYWKAEYKPGVLLDPELRFYARLDFRPVRLVENYFNDPESLNYGVIVEYKEPVSHLVQAH